MISAVLLSVLLSVLLPLSAAGCSATVGGPPAPSPAADTDAGPGWIDLNAPDSVPAGVSYDDGVFTVDGAGTYRVSGRLEGKLAVDADGPVTLILEGVSLTGANCLHVRSGDPVILIGAVGTENVFSDVAPDPASGEASADASAETSSEEPEAPPAEEAEEAAESEPGDTEGSDVYGAVITSRAPLLFAAGSITVHAGTGNGIRAKGGLTVQDADLAITAMHHGVRARGAVTVLGGSLDISAGADAVCVDAERVTPAAVELRSGHVSLTAGGRGIDAEGAVSVNGGTLSVVSEDDAVRAETIAVSGGELSLDAQGDGLQALTDLTVSGGTLSVTTGGGGGDAASHPGESFGPWAQSAAEESASAKGLKSDGALTVSGGTIGLSTADDSIHCGTLFTMTGGSVTICSNDDAIHSDDWLVIEDGTVRIDDCFEGLEAYAVEVRGGDVVIRAVNDGVNANGMEMMFRRSTETEESSFVSLSGASTTYFLMAGGKVDLVVTGSTMNQGDGVDSNGAVYITGGEIIVSTFGSFMENGLDTGWGGPVVTGGKVLAGGSSTMAEGFSSYSTQCCAVVAMSYMPDGTEVVLSDAEGNVLWDVVLADGFSCLQISHPAMQEGQVYTLTYGNQSTTLDFTNTTNIENSRGFGFRPF